MHPKVGNGIRKVRYKPGPHTANKQICRLPPAVSMPTDSDRLSFMVRHLEAANVSARLHFEGPRAGNRVPRLLSKRYTTNEIFQLGAAAPSMNAWSAVKGAHMYEQLMRHVSFEQEQGPKQK